MASKNIANQSVLNKSRLDKFILVFSVPEALKSTSSKNERQTEHKSYQRVIPDTLQYSIYGVVVPSVSVPAVDVPFSGQTLKVSSHSRPAYGEVAVNFTIDNEFNNWWYIWRWLDVLNDSKHSSYDKHNVGTTNLRPIGKGFHGSHVDLEQSGRAGAQWRPPARTGDTRQHPSVDKDIQPGGPELMRDYQTDFTIFGLNEYNKHIVEFTYTKAFPVSLSEISYSHREPGEIETSFSFAFTQLLVKLL